VLPLYQVRPDLTEGRLRVILPSVRPLFDYFRMVFRADDPRRAVFQALAATLLDEPLV
jgi:LysR family transcriptional regulator, glycine cleavage system transcriptional activator